MHASWQKILKWMGLLVVVWKGLALGFALLATQLLPLNQMFTPFPYFSAKLPYLIWIWGNFDGFHYMEIAFRGYRNLEQPFFPLFPFLIHLSSMVTGWPVLLSGVFVSHLALLGSLVILLKLFWLDNQSKSWRLFLATILFFPTAFYLGAVYNDSLYLFLATSCLWFGRKQRWAVAGIFAGFATLARLNGVALGVFLAAEYFTTNLVMPAHTCNLVSVWKEARQQMSVKRIWHSKIWMGLLIPGSLIGYMIYIQVTQGNWRLLFSSMEVWDQSKLTFPPQLIWRYFKIFALAPMHQLNFWVAVTEFGFVMFYLQMMLLGWRKIRLSYWLFFAISILIPWMTGTFQGMPRYGLHIYPLFLILSLSLEKKSLFAKMLYFTCSLAVFLFCVTLFTRGYFIA